MKTATDKLKIYFYCTLVLSALCAILRSVSLLTAFDSKVGYFNSKLVMPHIHLALIIASVIFFASLFFFLKKAPLSKELPVFSHLNVFAGFMCGTTYISSIALLLLYQRGSVGIIHLVILASCAISVIYFFYDALCPAEKKSPYRVVLAIAAVVSLISIIIDENIDYTVPLNNPNKVIIFLTFISISLFLVQDMRFAVNRPLPRAYVFTALTSFLLCVSSSVPGIIGHYANILSGVDFLIYYMIALAYGIYIFARLSAYVKYSSFVTASSVEEASAEVQPDEISENT